MSPPTAGAKDGDRRGNKESHRNENGRKASARRYQRVKALGCLVKSDRVESFRGTMLRKNWYVYACLISVVVLILKVWL